MALKQMHPLLPAATALEYGHRAGIGLERQGHVPGVALNARLDDETRDATLQWVSPPRGDAEQLDHHRITEDSAEAIALALVHGARRWVVRRRLQRGEFADWLLQDPEARSVALEVSGIAEGEDHQRLRTKIAQVARARIASKRAACVVELSIPRATVATVGGRR
jgi:hypothetical protein